MADRDQPSADRVLSGLVLQLEDYLRAGLAHVSRDAHLLGATGASPQALLGKPAVAPGPVLAGAVSAGDPQVTSPRKMSMAERFAAASAGSAATPVPAMREEPAAVRSVDQEDDQGEAMPRAVAAVADQGKPIAARQRPDALSVIQQEVAGCTRCSELASTRTQTVFGVGSPTARLCFLGEAPGADEDRLGEPFVGRAGQLLTKIIEACGMQRSDVYILNILKCRPPGNRNPLPLEATNCRGFLDRQLDVIRPEFICCLGAVAAQNLLDMQSSIGKLRGQFFHHRSAQVICTYHPAYLLRNPDAKRLVWDDMKLLMARMGIKLSS